MKRYDWKQLLPDWLLLFGVCGAAIGCLQASYTLPAAGWLWLWMLLLTGLLCALLRLPKPWIPALAVPVLGLLCLWVFRQPLVRSLEALWQSCLQQLAPKYPNLYTVFFVAETPVTYDLTPALLLLSGTLAYLLCLFTVCLRSTLPAVLTAAVFASPCFFLTNLTDRDTVALLLMVLAACLLVMIFAGGTQRRSPAESLKATLWALAPAALLLGLLLLLFPRKNYRPPLTFEQISRQIEQLGERINGTPQQETASGFRRTVELRTLGEKTEARGIVMNVASGDRYSEEYLYLRGAAYERFDGESWQLNPDPPTRSGAGSPLNCANDSFPSCKIDIQTTRQEPLLYVPSYAADVPSSSVFDYYVPNPSPPQTSYSFQCRYPVLRSERFDTAMYDLGTGTNVPETRVDAYEHCLELPETTRTALLAWAEAHGIPTPNSVEAHTLTVEWICAALQSAGTYTTSPKTPPADRDFCEWFLGDGADDADLHGYCVHYATAMAALCRAMGIPARYVEGYVTALRPAPESSGQAGMRTADVEERQAHAWVEVWLEGAGWVRFDPTPASGLEQTAAPYGSGDAYRPDETELPTDEGTEPAATEPTPTQPDETAPLETESPTEPPEPTLPEQTETPGADAAQTKRISPLWWLLTLLLIPPLLWLLRVLRRSRRRRREAALHGNELALWRWQRYRRLCRVLRRKPDEAALALAQKARFSQHTLDETELALLAERVAAAETGLRTLPLPRRLWHSYWLL